MATTFTITFEQDMSTLSAGGFALWLDSCIRAEAEDDPGSDHGPFTVAIR